MHRHVATVDRTSQAMYAELHRMHGSLSTVEGNGKRMQAQLQTMQQQLVRVSVCLFECMYVCVRACMRVRARVIRCCCLHCSSLCKGFEASSGVLSLALLPCQTPIHRAGASWWAMTLGLLSIERHALTAPSDALTACTLTVLCTVFEF